jgi:DNA polymerase-3 subunit gamma/tau
MSYEVFARKYRPRVFEDLVGQEAVAQALRYAVAAGRTASVYLFAGSHGVGKTSVARILAKALNCPNVKDGDPCGACELCESIARGECLDVVEIDAASNSKVDDVRALRESVGYKPASARFKVYILDEVHRLSTSAFDALLKTFEESPPLVRFVLATTELHKVPSTILSRAQVFRFRRAGLDALTKRLRVICEAEKLSVDEEALRTIARRARGSIRDSQKLLDQVAALAGASGSPHTITARDVAFLLGDASADVVVRCLAALAAGDRVGALLGEVHGFLEQGGRADALATDLLEALRGALYLKAGGSTSPLLEDVALSPEDLKPVSDALSEEGLLYALQLLQDAQTKMRDAREPRLLLELVLVRLARARELRPVGEVLARLERLERALGAPGVVSARGPAPAAAPAAPAPTPPAPAPSSPPPPPPARPPSPGSSPPRARAAYDYPAEFRGATASDPPPPPPVFVSEPGRPSVPALAPTPSAGAAVGLAVADPPQVALETVAAAWDRVRATASAKNVLLGRALDRSRPLAVAGNVLRVEVRVSDLVWGQLQESAGPASEIVREAAGVPAIELRFERAKEAPQAPTPGAAPVRAGSVYDEPIVQTTQRILGSLPLGGTW